MPNVTNISGADFGFNFSGSEFLLVKGENSVTDDEYAELLKQPMFIEIAKLGKFKIQITKKKSEPEK